MRQHNTAGSSVRQHSNTCAKRSTRAAARKSLQAQLAAGGGPGVGARSPSPRGLRAKRAARRERADSAHTAGRCMRQHNTRGSLRAPAKKHLRGAQHARAARKSLQAQLAAGRGPGVGARSPSPRGAESEANSRGGSAPPARRATGSFMRQHTPNTAIPCPALARNKGRRRVNHRHGRRTITATKRTHTQKRRARPSVSLIGLINPGSYLLSRDLSSDKAPGKAPEGL